MMLMGARTGTYIGVRLPFSGDLRYCCKSDYTRLAACLLQLDRYVGSERIGGNSRVCDEVAAWWCGTLPARRIRADQYHDVPYTRFVRVLKTKDVPALGRWVAEDDGQ